MTSLVDRLWYGQGRPLWVLWPFAWLYRAVTARRRQRALAGAGRPAPLSLPVIVVGNITAGGTGKSPLTAWLVEALRDAGWSPVVVTRGYGGKSDHYPLLVKGNSSPSEAGDEPVMLARHCNCPVVVDPQRYRAGQWAGDNRLGDVLVCDDGLQHYALPRDIELAVFDGQRGGWQWRPDTGRPLREPVSRLASVDFVITNGSRPLALSHPRQYCMTLAPAQLRHLLTDELKPVTWLQGLKVRAVAGIGNPQRFFDTLKTMGAQVRAQAFADHYAYRASDLDTRPDEVLVMTAKDAVKCQNIAPENAWVLDVRAELPDAFRLELLTQLNALYPRNASQTHQ